MEKIKVLLEQVYENKITNEFDAVIPVIGDEGVGKSTLIVQCMIFWQKITGKDQNPEDILEAFVYDRDGLKETMAKSDNRSVIPVPDAARALHKKETMKGEQVELEKDFFDVRTKEFLFLLGFQDWGTVPSFLQERRAKAALFIPRRGVVRGYNRRSLDERLEKDTWPASDLTASFPSLEGTEIWDRYKELDRQKKNERMYGHDDEEEKELTAREIVDEVQEQGVHNFVSVNPTNEQRYIDPDLIEFEFECSARMAKKVKKVLARDHEPVVVEAGV